MTLKEFLEYLKMPIKLRNCDREREELRKWFKTKEFKEYEAERVKKLGPKVALANIERLDSGLFSFLPEDATIISMALENDPKSILGQEKLKDKRSRFLSTDTPMFDLSLVVKEIREKKYPIPDGLDKEMINSYCDRCADWIESFEKNYESTKAYIQGKIQEYNNKTEGQFRDSIAELRKAQTTYNSSEYTKIIDSLETINKPDPVGKDFPLSSEQLYVLKLLRVKKLIKEYIDHKIDSGVKQNVYKKLAAVEKLSQNIDERLRLVDMKQFKYGVKGKKIVALPSDDPKVKVMEVDLSKEPLTYDAELDESRSTISHHYGKYEEPKRVEDREQLNTQYEKVSKVYKDVNKEEMENAYNCMSRIMLSALVHGKDSKELQKLDAQQQKFWEHPVGNIQKEKLRAEQEAKKEAQQESTARVMR